jgi:hypothetical protein
MDVFDEIEEIVRADAHDHIVRTRGGYKGAREVLARHGRTTAHPLGWPAGG